MRSLTLILSTITEAACYNCLFIGHSFFVPIGRSMDLFVGDAGVSHTHQEVFSAGASGTPSALWADTIKRNEAQAILDTGNVDLLGLPLDDTRDSGGNLTTDAYENWINYALSKNPNTKFMVGLPWLSFPADYDTIAYTSNQRTGVGTVWPTLRDSLRATYPTVTIIDCPYNLGIVETRLLFDAGALGADVTALFGGCDEDESGESECGSNVFNDDRGHIGPFSRKLAALIWLNRIYDVDLSTYTSSALTNSYGAGGTPFTTDITAFAKAVLDAYDAGNLCGTTPCYDINGDGGGPSSGCVTCDPPTGPYCNSTASMGSACVEQVQRANCALTASYSWSAKTDWANGPIHENVVWGTAVPSQQAMTIWETEAQSGADPVPVLVFVHGGQWGGKDHTPANMHAVFLPLIAKGFLVVSLGYRLSGTAIFPACIDDVEEGIRWLKARAATYNLDPNRIIVGGVSAGGHIVSLLGTRNPPGSPSRPAAIVNFYGPTDIDFPVPADSGIARLLGCIPGTPGTACSDLAKTASPINHVDVTDPPFLHLYGDADTTAPPAFGIMFQDAFVASGHADSTFILTPGAGHFSGTVLGLYPNGPGSTEGTRIFEDWIVDHAKCGGDGAPSVPPSPPSPPAPPSVPPLPPAPPPAPPPVPPSC